jgi:hypothetical protein
MALEQEGEEKCLMRFSWYFQVGRLSDVVITRRN